MKKVVKVIGIVLGIIIILGIIFFAIDYNRVKKQETPIFCINVGTLNDGGTKEYLGLGYKVIDFHTLAGYDDIKIGTWFIDYNDFDDERSIYDKKFEESQEDNTMALNKSVNFTKTYNVITDLKRTDQTGEYNYYVIEQYQLGEPTVVKVRTMYNLQENVNYEFSFEGIKTKNEEYSIQEIFNTFTIVNIEKTDKVGMEQRIDSITENGPQNSSNPLDYVEANKDIYNELLDNPKETFEYAIKDLIDTNASNGLKSYIEALLCSEINNGFKYDFESASDFLEHYIEYLNNSNNNELNNYDKYAKTILK